MSEPASEKTREAAAQGDGWDRTKANIKTIGGAILLALLIRIVLFEAFEIEGPSMEPSLLNGDRVVVAKFLYGLFMPFTDEAVLTWGLPDAGEVVIVHSPADNIDIVKRVIGVPGDRIEVRDGVVYRNGESIRGDVVGPCEGDRQHPDSPCQWIEEAIGDETWHISHAPPPFDHHSEHEMGEVTVPPGHVFVMGDHRDHSNDSRRIGMIPADRVKGRALAIYWSNDAHVRWNRLFQGID